jgi:hypothetical protein
MAWPSYRRPILLLQVVHLTGLTTAPHTFTPLASGHWLSLRVHHLIRGLTLLGKA